MSEISANTASVGIVNSSSKAPALAAKPIGPGSGSVSAAIKVEVAPPTPRMDPQEMLVQLSHALSELNKQMDHTGRSLGFSMDHSIAGNVITVTNKDTGEVIRQIPGEAVLNIAHSIDSLKGVIYSKLI